MTEIKKNHVIEQQRYLSDDLILHEILIRLPVKSILRFKIVSKLWYSTLSSSKFANYHLMKFRISPPSAPVNTLFIESCRNYYLFSYNDAKNSGKLKDKCVKLDIDFGVEGYFNFTGCCNGLICLTHDSDKFFVLWNPATRKLHKYESDVFLNPFNVLNPNPRIATGFGYVSSVDDYKYVRILTLSLETVPVNSNIVHIFSIRKNKWRKIDFDDNAVFPYGQPVLFNEKLYWAGYRKQGAINFNHHIFCFDLRLEKINVIRLNLDDFVYLGVMEGCLIKLNYEKNKGHELRMRIMESPMIETSFRFPKGMVLDISSQMVPYTKTGSFFVTGSSIEVVKSGNAHRTALWLVDAGMKPMKCTTLLKFTDSIIISSYVPSLLSPFPIEELSEAQRL
ncbi:F-box protein CPR1-like [Silene latifolia]|uniref:F-box protein CPR1-like n=1 Tax=Silene latifolia TaxID=37657 RepID=UPI003D782E54